MKFRDLIFGLAGFAAVAGLYFLTRPSPPPATLPAPSATVSEIKLTRQQVAIQIDAAGVVVAGAAQTDIILGAPGIVANLAVSPGQAVAKGQILADILPDPQSVATARKAQAAVDAAAAGRGHVSALLSQHLATQADLASATQILQDAQADLAASRSAGMGLKLSIRAPFDGTVIAIPAAAGSMLQAGATLLQLAATNGLSIRAGFTPTEALQIRPGDPATMTLLDTGANVTAIVAQRSAMLNPQTGLIDVTLLSKMPVLLGEPVAVSITSGSVTGYEVPRDAVLSDEQGDYVYQLDASRIAHRKNVRVLESVGGNIVLAPDLDSAMPVAAIGAYQLADGMAATLQDTAP